MIAPPFSQAVALCQGWQGKRYEESRSMQLTEALKLALQSLWGNKMRTVLTLIGVVMGVASVIMVITLVNGANKYIADKLSSHGADVFTISRMPSVIMGPQEYF